MPLPTLTTKLEAVNVILSAAGEQPVTSLTGTTADAANAESILDEVSRAVQSPGYHFNTDKEVPFVPDNTTKEITLPSNILKIDADVYDFSDVDVVQRGAKLYDRKNRTYQFKRTIKADVVYLLPFEELTEAARRYIAVRSARVFHDRFVGSQEQHRFTSEDEYTAKQDFVSANLQNQDANIFRSNPRMLASVLRR